MVSLALQQTIDALSIEERISLLEYLERTTDIGDMTLTDDQLAELERRDAQMDADPGIGIPGDEFIERLKAKWL